jgi:hypothetical protein
VPNTVLRSVSVTVFTSVNDASAALESMVAVARSTAVQQYALLPESNAVSGMFVEASGVTPW